MADNIPDERKWQIYQEGRNAYNSGNPFCPYTGESEYIWRAGYEEALSDDYGLAEDYEL